MTWVKIEDSPYGTHALPYGVFVRADGRPTIGARIGDLVLDLAWAEERRLVDAAGTLGQPTLNGFMATGRPVWDRVRARLVDLLTDEARRAEVEPLLVPLADVSLVRPVDIADYVDFYASEQHATNVGKLFRPGQPPLTPNWKHLPIGYHGRAGTVVVSGTDIVRPCGQRKDADGPTFGPSTRLDIEAEVGFLVGVPSALGSRVAVDAFADHVFGVVLVNDWSARDIQAWEYVPLGPFLGKSFATSMSAWVTPLAALDAARMPTPMQDPIPLPYLNGDHHGYDISITVDWNGTEVSRPPFAWMYWTAAQQLAHMTVNGASLRTGDLYASGTVSGPMRAETGSFLELTWGGAEPVTLADGTTRTFLLDGDTITLTATAPGPDHTVVPLGEVRGTVLPATGQPFC